MNYKDVSKAVEELSSNPPPKSLELVRLRRVVKLVTNDLEFFVVMGRGGDYLLTPKTFCSCKDFEINVVMRNKRKSCYHLVGLELAIKENLLREVKVGFNELLDIVFECIYEGKSRTLRKLLMVSAGGGSSPL